MLPSQPLPVSDGMDATVQDRCFCIWSLRSPAYLADGSVFALLAPDFLWLSWRLFAWSSFWVVQFLFVSALFFVSLLLLYFWESYLCILYVPPYRSLNRKFPISIMQTDFLLFPMDNRAVCGLLNQFHLPRCERNVFARTFRLLIFSPCHAFTHFKYNKDQSPVSKHYRFRNQLTRFPFPFAKAFFAHINTIIPVAVMWWTGKRTFKVLKDV